MDQGDPLISERFARQICLPPVGEAGQNRLAAAQVLVVGAGGLGCPALQYLAAGGVGRLGIVDPDAVSLSNLHRQSLFSGDDIGARKADAARARLQRVNPGVTIDAFCERLTPANVSRLAAGAQVIIDAADSFAVSYILSDFCKAQGRALISASALGLTGYAGGFCGPAPSLRAVFPTPPAMAATCETAGIMGPITGVLGALQAQLAMAHILGLKPSPLGRLVRVDMGQFQFGGFSFENAPEPAAPMPFIAPSQLGPEDQLLDLRGAGEAPRLLAPEARRITPQGLGRLGPPQRGRIVLCCKTGLRAWRAGEDLLRRGIRDIALMAEVAV